MLLTSSLKSESITASDEVSKLAMQEHNETGGLLKSGIDPECYNAMVGETNDDPFNLRQPVLPPCQRQMPIDPYPLPSKENQLWKKKKQRGAFK